MSLCQDVNDEIKSKNKKEILESSTNKGKKEKEKKKKKYNSGTLGHRPVIKKILFGNNLCTNMTFFKRDNTRLLLYIVFP